MEYFVDIKLRSRRHLTKRMLLAIAQIGGVATGKIGGRRLETTLTVTADDAKYAEACVLNFIRRRLPSEFDVIEARAVPQPMCARTTTIAAVPVTISAGRREGLGP
jgi:hypothetical protein